VAVEIYRVCDQLCREDPGLQLKARTVKEGGSWKGKYLVMTATDVEDHALRSELARRGFRAPGVQNVDQFSYVEYFRSDIGPVYHMRTSAGSGGASGAFIMGKAAIEYLHPEYVISAGVCFGLREEKQALGDIIISEHIHDYERIRLSPSRPED